MSETPDIGWIDEFIERIRPFVAVRLTDNVVIRMPNEAFKVNRTGALALDHLLKGGRVAEILEARDNDSETAKQLNSFFYDMVLMLKGELCENYSSPALNRTTFELGYIELPVLSEIALTDRCNLKCSFCYAACAHVCSATGDEHGEMSTDDVKTVLTAVREDAEVPSVSFTGGEPTLRRDLAELIAYAHDELKMRVNLITNGSLITEEMAQSFKDAGLASAQVSIESPIEEIHDEIVGVPGSFKKSVTGITALKKAAVRVHPHTTICRANAESVTGMAAFAKDLDIPRFSTNMVVPAGRGTDEEILVGYAEIGAVLEGVMEVAKAEGIEFMWYSPTPVCLFNPVKHGLGNKGCSACEGLLSVDYKGRILPCSSWDEPLGSLLTDDFNEIWFSERSKFIRAKGEAHSGCKTCEHFALCHGACPLYFDVHGYAEIEEIVQKLTKEAAV